MKGTRKDYDFAFKEKAVLLSYKGKCLVKLEKELGLYRGALTIWRHEYRKFDIEGLGNTYLKSNIERQKISELGKKIKKSDLKFEILKNAGQYLNRESPMIFYFIAGNEKLYSIRMMCEVLAVNRSTYHGWKNQFVSRTQERKDLIKKEIITIFFACKKRYGCQRITVELQNLGYQISCSTVNKYMKELGLSSIVKKN
jgi:transposase-like protein